MRHSPTTASQPSLPAIDHPASQLAYTRLAALYAPTQSHARAESRTHTHTNTYTRNLTPTYKRLYKYTPTHAPTASIR